MKSKIKNFFNSSSFFLVMILCGVFVGFMLSAAIYPSVTDIIAKRKYSVDDELHDRYIAGYENGHEDGYHEGYNEGEAFGYDKGYDEGYHEGYNEGEAFGYDGGFDSGYDSCYQENGDAQSNYNEGFNDGYDAAYEDYLNGTLSDYADE